MNNAEEIVSFLKRLALPESVDSDQRKQQREDAVKDLLTVTTAIMGQKELQTAPVLQAAYDLALKKPEAITGLMAVILLGMAGREKPDMAKEAVNLLTDIMTRTSCAPLHAQAANSLVNVFSQDGRIWGELQGYFRERIAACGIADAVAVKIEQETESVYEQRRAAFQKNWNRSLKPE